MRFSKAASLVLSAVFLFTLSACSDPAPTGDELDGTSSTVSTDFVPGGNVSSEPEPVIEYFTNPLTGVKDLTAEQTSYRPAAVAINNISVAQKVQSGVGDADVIFETEVEGGITRLLALYKAPTNAISRIGSVRSARVVFAELASSMDAVYVFHGMDEEYCKPRLSELGIPRIEISSKNYGGRYSNGLSSEHTLYTSGGNLFNAFESKGYHKGGDTGTWLSFDEARAVPSGGTASTVSAKFNSSYTTQFFYNPEAGTYSRGAKGNRLKDYITGVEEEFTNVFVLETSMTYYPNNKHRKISLSGGNGYYATKGGYEPITWSMSGTSSPMSFKNASGETLSVTAGNSYICIINKSSGKFTAE